MQRVVLAPLLAIVPIAEVQAARVDQLIEEMARRNRAQDEAERREEEAEERRRAQAEADAALKQRSTERRAISSDRASRAPPRPERAEAARSPPRQTYRPSGRSSDGCGGRGGPGWRKPNGKCARWRD